MTSGGKRPGSGRPVVAENEKRVQLSISVSQKTAQTLKIFRARGGRIGLLVDDLVAQHFGELK